MLLLRRTIYLHEIYFLWYTDTDRNECSRVSAEMYHLNHLDGSFDIKLVVNIKFTPIQNILIKLSVKILILSQLQYVF